MSIAFVLYTHSDCSDIYHKLAIPLIQKNVLSNIPWYVFINKEDEGIPEKFTRIIYSDKLPYSKRLSYCLDQITENYILFIHEDWIPVEPMKNLERVINLIQTNNHEIYTIRSYSNHGNYTLGEFVQNIDNQYALYKIPLNAPYRFSLQPAVWKRTFFRDICIKYNNFSIWELEGKPVQDFTRQFPNNFYYIHLRNPERLHYSYLSVMSYFYPHIHAVFKKKWTISENPLLEKILVEYNIDKSIRGFF